MMNFQIGNGISLFPFTPLYKEVRKMAKDEKAQEAAAVEEKGTAITIVATKEVGGEKREASFEFDFLGSAKEAIEKFGDEVVHSNFISACKITAQGAMRRMLEKGVPADSITAKMAEWAPGVSLNRESDPTSAMINKWATMSKEERDAFLAQLKQQS
jgi:hypothetical protein